MKSWLCLFSHSFVKKVGDLRVVIHRLDGTTEERLLHDTEYKVCKRCQAVDADLHFVFQSGGNR
jgi:hypothetical protein